MAYIDVQGKPCEWLDACGLAALALVKRRPISRIKASAAMARCMAGGTWRGVRLVVREEPGRGGRSGSRYLVAERSLPLDLRLRHRRNAGYDDRTAARRLVVDELERLAAEQGERRALVMVLDRANGGDLRDALFWAGFGPGQELKRAALTRWRRDFAQQRERDADPEWQALAGEAEKARASQRRARMPAERKPAAPSIHKITSDDLRQAARQDRALPKPDSKPRRIRRVA